jgi:hypothetical protein
MMGAVEFDNKLGAMTRKIRVVSSDLRLAAKVESLTAEQAQSVPYPLLGFRRAFA